MTAKRARHVTLLALGLFASPVCSGQITGKGWPEYGGTLAGQRYSEERQIDVGNVTRLRRAWTFHTHAQDGPGTETTRRQFFEATPVMWNKTLYFPTPFNKVFALRADTGVERWSFDPKIDLTKPAYIVAARGVTLWHSSRPTKGNCGRDRVLLATLDRRLIELDAVNGKPCLQFGKHGTVDAAQGVDIANLQLYSFTSPPIVVGDTVILGSCIGDNQQLFAASGLVRGYDVLTGKQKWSWEPLGWTQRQMPKQSGSGNAWAPLSADPERDLVFLPTGSPSVDFFGGARPGDNRDANSLVALKASTGELVWAFQFVHHDLWDYDTPSQPMLFTFRGSIPAVAVVTKSDMVFVFNRLSGKPLYPIVERPVAASTVPGEKAWPTQPFSTLPPLGQLTIKASDIHLANKQDQDFCRSWINRLDNHGLFTPPSLRGSLESPGNAGGANWGSVAFDPMRSVMYVRVSTLPYIVRLRRKGTPPTNRLEHFIANIRPTLPEWAGGPPPQLESQFKTPDRGGNNRDEDPMEGAPYAVDRQALMTQDATPCAPPPFGSIVAMNLNTGKKLWSVPHGVMVSGESGSVGMSGLVVTAGGLLFIGASNDPFLRAYDASDGRELWRGELPTSSMATPMTYSAGGRQFVVVAAGGSTSVKTGLSDAVIAFALPTPKLTSSKRPHMSTGKGLDQQ